MVKNIGNMRSKGFNKKLYPVALCFMKPNFSAKFEVHWYHGYLVLLLQSEEDEHYDFVKKPFTNIAHILHQIFDRG